MKIICIVVLIYNNVDHRSASYFHFPKVLIQSKTRLSNAGNFINSFLFFRGQQCCDCKEMKMEKKDLCVIKAFFTSLLLYFFCSFPKNLEKIK